ncbi:HdeD family acid-resistance protein [Chitinophaga lutea]
MLREFAKYWWLLVLRGVLAVLFGIMAFIWPGVTLAILIVFLGAYFLVDGIFSVVQAFRVRKEEQQWWVLLLQGLVGIGAGLIALFSPGVTSLFIVTLVAIWAIFTGILEIVWAIRMRKAIQGEWLLILAGIFSVIFGVLVLMLPAAGLVAIAWWLGFYAVFFGIFLISLGFRLKKWKPAA